MGNRHPHYFIEKGRDELFRQELSRQMRRLKKEDTPDAPTRWLQSKTFTLEEAAELVGVEEEEFLRMADERAVAHILTGKIHSFHALDLVSGFPDQFAHLTPPDVTYEDEVLKVGKTEIPTMAFGFRDAVMGRQLEEVLTSKYGFTTECAAMFESWLVPLQSGSSRIAISYALPEAIQLFANLRYGVLVWPHLDAWTSDQRGGDEKMNFTTAFLAQRSALTRKYAMKNMGPTMYCFDDKQYRANTSLIIPPENLPALRKELFKHARVKHMPARVPKKRAEPRKGLSERAKRRQARKPQNATWADKFFGDALPRMRMGRWWEVGDVFDAGGVPTADDRFRETDDTTRVRPGVILEKFEQEGEIFADALVGDERRTYVLQDRDVRGMQPDGKIPLGQLQFWLPETLLADPSLAELLDTKTPNEENEPASEMDEPELVDDRLGATTQVVDWGAQSGNGDEDDEEFTFNPASELPKYLQGTAEVRADNVEFLMQWWDEVRPHIDLEEVRGN
ncbi:hypothetical protein CMO91_02735 [Candidatus Woesearchaeota archaeon]|nr:hypothetical protein [Candidatus Woesearchaeota archaeon]